MLLLCSDDKQRMLLSCITIEIERQRYMINLQASDNAEKCRHAKAFTDDDGANLVLAKMTYSRSYLTRM